MTLAVVARITIQREVVGPIKHPAALHLRPLGHSAGRYEPVRQPDWGARKVPTLVCSSGDNLEICSINFKVERLTLKTREKAQFQG